MSEEFLKELEEIEKEELINSEDVEEFMDNLCDDNVEEEIEAYEEYPPEIIDEVDKLMAQKPIDLPAGMSLTEYQACLKPMINS